jgi:hypothetical protein
MSDAALFAKELSASQIQAEYQASKTSTPVSPATSEPSPPASSGSGSASQGSTASTGASPASGGTGATGTTGTGSNAKTIDLIVCKAESKGKVKCTTTLVAKSVKLKGKTATVSLTRAGKLDATGSGLNTAHGGLRLLLSFRRHLVAGKYTLTLKTRDGRHWKTVRRSITLK